MLSGGRHGGNAKEPLLELLNRDRYGAAVGTSQDNLPRSEREHELNALSKTGSHGKTMSSDEFSMHIDKNFKDNIYRSQNKLTHTLMKNQTVTQHKLILERISMQKKQFAEVALKKSIVHGQRVPMQGLKELEEYQQKESAIQRMDTNNFLKYLNRSSVPALNSGN